MIKGVDHVAIAVEDLDSALSLFETLLGLKAHHRETISEHKVEAATIKVGSTDIELVAGTSPESSISKFIEKRGPGIHHIALQVGDIATAISTLKSSNASMIDDTPRPGKENSQVAFIHPKSTGKILFELVEPAKD